MRREWGPAGPQSCLSSSRILRVGSLRVLGGGRTQLARAVAALCRGWHPSLMPANGVSYSPDHSGAYVSFIISGKQRPGSPRLALPVHSSPSTRFTWALCSRAQRAAGWVRCISYLPPSHWVLVGGRERGKARPGLPGTELGPAGPVL